MEKLRYQINLPFPNAKEKARALRCMDFIRCFGFRTVMATGFFAFLFFTVSPVSASSFREPWDLDGPEKISRSQEDKGFNPLRSFVEFYRAYISPIDGKDCPMYPSCSEYSIQSFKKHGLFIGWAMTCDRLYRCGRDELRLSPEIIINGEFRCYDPLEANDFWWYDGK
jgi:hypothetical protein